MRRRCSVEEQFFRMLNRFVEPHVRSGWGSPSIVPGGLIVLETKGRRTGRRSRVPLVATRIHHHVLVSTFRGRQSQWIKNLSADSDIRYWIRGRARTARALVIAPGRKAQDTRGVPSIVRWLATALLPYTHAGWAFAILSPATETARPQALGNRTRRHTSRG